MSKDFDFSNLRTKPKDFDFSYLRSSSKKEPESTPNVSLEKMLTTPGLFKSEFLRQKKEMSAGGKRGFKDLGQTGQQILTGAFNHKNYPELTKKIDQERAMYAASPEGQNPGIQANREFVANLPSGIAAIPAFAATGGSLPAMIAAGAGSGAVGSQLKYFPEGQDRGMAALEGGALGGALAGVGGGLAKIIKPLLHKISPQKTASFIQKGHDESLKKAENLYGHVEKEAEKRGIDTLPIPDTLIEQSERFFPKTDSYEKLIANAKTGDYKAIRKLQSDLREKGERLKSSGFQAERDKGEEAFDLRHKINEEVANSFDVFGHSDLKDKLSEANKTYKELKENYYAHPTISKLVAPGLRKVPKNINETVMEISEPMQKLRNLHPEVENEARMAKSKKNAMKLLKILGGLSLTGAVGGVAYKGAESSSLLKDLLGD